MKKSIKRNRSIVAKNRIYSKKQKTGVVGRGEGKEGPEEIGGAEREK